MPVIQRHSRCGAEDNPSSQIGGWAGESRELVSRERGAVRGDGCVAGAGEGLTPAGRSGEAPDNLGFRGAAQESSPGPCEEGANTSRPVATPGSESRQAKPAGGWRKPDPYRALACGGPADGALAGRRVTRANTRRPAGAPRWPARMVIGSTSTRGAGSSARRGRWGPACVPGGRRRARMGSGRRCVRPPRPSVQAFALGCVSRRFAEGGASRWRGTPNDRRTRRACSALTWDVGGVRGARRGSGDRRRLGEDLDGRRLARMKWAASPPTCTRAGRSTSRAA